MDHSEVAQGAIERLEAAAASGEREAVDSAVQIAMDLVADALIFGRREIVEGLLRPVERIASELATGASSAPKVAEAIGQLRALTTMLGVAACRQPAPSVSDVAREPKYHSILEALLSCDDAFTNRELARQTGLTEETVARRLPELRAARIVDSKRVWKSMKNWLRSEIVDEVRAALSANSMSEQKREPESLRSMAEDFMVTARQVVGDERIGLVVGCATMAGLALELGHRGPRLRSNIKQTSSLKVTEGPDNNFTAEISDEYQNTILMLRASEARDGFEVKVNQQVYEIPL